jgi:hemerythrin-like domain-containing protein
MHHAIDTLRHEHDAITLGLNILTRMDQRMAAEHITDIEDLSALTDFLKSFADTCHHGKEEGFLFPALTAKDDKQAQAPVQRLLDEHAQGRRLLGRMQAALQPELNVSAFHEAANAYAALLLAHIEKENTLLFPMAERLLSPAEQSDMANAFETFEEQVMGPGQHEALHATLKRLLAKYPA